MSDIMKGLKKTWLKGVEAIGNAASNIAENAKYKVSEMNLETRRREILADFGSIAYEMWQRGATFPPALEQQLQQLSALDEQLTAIRAQRIAAAKEAKLASEAAEAAARKTGILEEVPEEAETAPSTESAEAQGDAPQEDREEAGTEEDAGHPSDATQA